jgi:hypothetical protein
MIVDRRSPDGLTLVWCFALCGRATESGDRRWAVQQADLQRTAPAVQRPTKAAGPAVAASSARISTLTTVL